MTTPLNIRHYGDKSMAEELKPELDTQKVTQVNIATPPKPASPDIYRMPIEEKIKNNL